MKRTGGARSPEVHRWRQGEVWAGLRSRRRVFLILVLLFFPFLFVLDPPWVLWLPWLLAIVVSGIRAQRWPCPRCERPFFLQEHRYASDMPFATAWRSNRCVHCGLPLWRDPRSGSR
jgi:hypothetical protein